MVGADIPMGVLVVSEAMVEVMVGTDTVVEGVVPSAAVVISGFAHFRACGGLRVCGGVYGGHKDYAATYLEFLDL